MFAKQRLYLTADRKALVLQDDSAAATLYATPGDEIPDSAAALFGLVDGRLPSAGASARLPAVGEKLKDPPPAKKPAARTAKTGKGAAVKNGSTTKEAVPGANKEAATGENKSTGADAGAAGAAAHGDHGSGGTADAAGGTGA